METEEILHAKLSRTMKYTSDWRVSEVNFK